MVAKKSSPKTVKKTVVTKKITKKPTKKIVKSSIVKVKSSVVPKKKGGRVPVKKKEFIMDQLEKMVKNGNSLGPTNIQLADQYDVNRETIAKYLQDIYSRIPPEDIKHTQVKIQTMFDKLFRIAQRMLSDAKTIDERQKAGEFMLKCFDRFQDFLERFEVKTKVADKMEIKGMIINANLDLETEAKKILEEI